MPIPGTDLSRWSHPRSAMASKQAHVSIRDALAADDRLSEFKHEVLLQGSYKNNTNLRRDSDVDLVIRLAHKLSPGVAALSGKQLQENASHQAAHRHWQSFRRRAMRVMRNRYGDSVTSGRKTIKLAKGELHADANLVVTLSYKAGIALYLPDEHRWVVSFPQQHHERGLAKEEATSRRFKRTVRMFKAARNWLVDKEVVAKEDTPSYFIECLLYNVPDSLFAPKLAPTYTGILDWLQKVSLQDFQCQNGRVDMFRLGRESGPCRRRRHSSGRCRGCGTPGVESGRLTIRTSSLRSWADYSRETVVAPSRIRFRRSNARTKVAIQTGAVSSAEAEVKVHPLAEEGS